MADAQRQFRRRGKQVYPNSLGITGQAFQTGKVIYTNKVERMNGFLPSIDNLTTNITDVHNFMIVPIFGHKSRIETRNGELESAKADEEADPNIKRMPIGIIQFINKSGLSA